MAWSEVQFDPKGKSTMDVARRMKVVVSVPEAINCLHNEGKIDVFRFKNYCRNEDVEPVVDWLTKNASKIPTLVLFNFAIGENRKPIVDGWKNRLVTAARNAFMAAVPVSTELHPIEATKRELGVMDYAPDSKAEVFSVSFNEMDEDRVQEGWNAMSVPGKMPGEIRFIDIPQYSEASCRELIKTLHKPGSPPIGVPFVISLAEAQEHLKQAKEIKAKLETISSEDSAFPTLRKAYELLLKSVDEAIAKEQKLIWVVGGTKNLTA